MKLRSRAQLELAAFLGTTAFRLLMGTVRFRTRELAPGVLPDSRGKSRNYIYAFWHEALFLPGAMFARPSITVLISQHADGELVADFGRRIGFSVARGSTTRGGLSALRQLMRAARVGDLGITPDGPKGPRRQAQQGLVYLASRTRLPIVPLGYAYGRCWRINSWDRFMLPKPFTAGYGVSGEPIEIPHGITTDEVPRYLERVQAALDQTTDLSETWAATGRFPTIPQSCSVGSKKPSPPKDRDTSSPG